MNNFQDEKTHRFIEKNTTVFYTHLNFKKKVVSTIAYLKCAQKRKGIAVCKGKLGNPHKKSPETLPFKTPHKASL